MFRLFHKFLCNEGERRVTGDEIRGQALGRKALDGIDSLAMYLDENRYRPREYLFKGQTGGRYFSESL